MATAPGPAREIPSGPGALRRPIDNTANTITANAQISRSNFAATLSQQRWLIVYRYRFSATDWDVLGATLTWNGTVAIRGTIDNSAANHIEPGVSSAAGGAPVPQFGVTFEETSGLNRLRGMVVDGNLLTVVANTNLSALLSAPAPYYPRIETDGCRYVVTYANGLPAYAATLAVVNSAFVVHEAPQEIGSGMDAYSLNIASRASGGGSLTGYAIVFRNDLVTPDPIVFATYEGHAAGGLSLRQTGCNGLGMTASGRAALGHSVSGTLTGVGIDLPGMLIGVPAPAFPLCGSCLVGIDLAGPVVHLPNLANVTLGIPCGTVLVGSTVSLQGYAVGTGPCIAGLRLSHTLDIAIQ